MAGAKWSDDTKFTEGGVPRIGDKIMGLRSSANYKFDINDGIADGNGNYLFKWVTTGASATDYIQLTNGETGSVPVLEVAGSNTNIGLDIKTKGTGKISINSSAATFDTFLDDDTMSADDPNALSSQQSIKAYVDNSLGSGAGGSNTQIQYNNAGAFGGDSGFTTDGAGSVNITGDLDVDNLNLNGNTLSSTDTNGNINIDPDGTGEVIINSTVGVVGVIDDDTFSTATDDTLATSESTKAYADLMLPLAGGTMSGVISMGSNTIDGLPVPANSDEAATKGYVDGIAFNTHPACLYATTADLSGYTYDNGTAGVGATLTAGSNGAFSVDGASPALNDRILVKDMATAAYNGIYDLSTVGDGSNPAVLTRSTDFDEASDMDAGDQVIVVLGTANAGTKWTMTQTSAITVGTTDIDWRNDTNTGLGTMSTQDANAVAITGGAIDGVSAGATTELTYLAVDQVIINDNEITSKTANDLQISSANGQDVIIVPANGQNVVITLNGASEVVIDGTTGIVGVIDDDTFSTATNDTLATSESTKAYVDTEVSNNSGSAGNLFMLMGG